MPRPIDSITAWTNNKNNVRGIVFRSGDWEADFSGDRDNEIDEITWIFSESDPVLAMWGKTDDEEKITQLGWAKLDEEC